MTKNYCSFEEIAQAGSRQAFPSDYGHTGITVREYMATAIMSGMNLISPLAYGESFEGRIANRAACAVAQTDALIAALRKEPRS